MTDAARPQINELVWNVEPGRTATVLLQSDQTAERLMVFEEVTPAGTAAPLHLHHESDEVMYILNGDFIAKVGDKLTRGGPGTCVFIPRGTPHAWKNSGSESGRALFVYAPARAGKLFEGFARSGGKSPDTDIAEFLKRCDVEIVGPEPF